MFRCGLADALFPLTPSLSLREREKRQPVFGLIEGLGVPMRNVTRIVHGRVGERAVPPHPFPLPEGEGESSASLQPDRRTRFANAADSGVPLSLSEREKRQPVFSLMSVTTAHAL